MLSFLGVMQSRAETDEPEQPMQGKLLRSTTGRPLDNAGLANGQVPLKKDDVYDVQKQTMAEVTLDVDGRSVVVPTRDLLITPKKKTSAASSKAGAGAGAKAGAGRSMEAMKFLDKLSPKAQEKFLAEARSHADELKAMSAEDRKEFIREIYIRILKEDQANK